VPFFAAKAEGMGIDILPPDVNLSDHEFVVVDGNIRFGLDAVKGVGLRGGRGDQGGARGGWGIRLDLGLLHRVDPAGVNKRAIEALIKCGAFGSTGATRKGMLSVLEQAQAAGQQAQLDAQIGQGSIFDLGDVGGATPAPPRPFYGTAALRRSRLEEFEQASCWPSRRRPSGSSSPRTRSRRCARRCARPSTRRWPRCPTTRTATGSPPAASSPRPRRSARRRATR
jgi:DNA polymerase-3 subunit alpha